MARAGLRDAALLDQCVVSLRLRAHQKKFGEKMAGELAGSSHDTCYSYCSAQTESRNGRQASCTRLSHSTDALPLLLQPAG